MDSGSPSLIWSAEFGTGLRNLNEMRYNEDIEDVITYLSSMDKTDRDGQRFFLLGQAQYRLDRHEEAFSNFIKAAKSGIFSGYYRAGEILIDNEHDFKGPVPESYEPKQLFLKAANQGHVWAKLLLLKLKSGDSWFDRLRFYNFRFFVAPVLILRFSLFDSNNERIRF